MRNISLAFTLIVVSLNATAEEFEHCNALIEHGVTNVTKYMSADHSLAYKWYSNCGQDFSNASDSSVRSASISVFGYGSGGAGSNSQHLRTRLKQWCDKNAEFASTKQDLYEEARIISEPALDAWNKCQAIAQKGINIIPSIQGEYDEFIHFTVDSKSDGNYLFYGVSESGYTCSVQNKDGSDLPSDKINRSANEFFLMAKAHPQIDNSNIHISCRRNMPEVNEQNGVGTIKYPQGHITVMTSGPALPITIPKVVESYSVTPPKSVLAFASKTCPEGWQEYAPAYGRFVRGIDKSENKVDPAGLREPGDTQDESFLHHSHTYGDIYWSEAWGSISGGLYGNKGDQDRDNRGYEMTRRTTEVGGDETRPDNVALLYCIKG
ncbi:hypothetical protein NXE12_000057 [Vibrio fluvialis]|nr:hypothetical protein [Vibrio fluvialis]EKO3529453.1 hypothetical protein [Vibrio fluvialis]